LDWVFRFSAPIGIVSVSEKNIAALQHGKNCAFEAIETFVFHQMIKSKDQTTALVCENASNEKYREI